MTAIVGITTGTTLVLAGDAAGVTAKGEMHVRAEPKVFERDGYAIGFTTSFRMGQILRYEMDLPTPPTEGDLHAFMVTSFVPAVREAFGKHGFAKSIQHGERAGAAHYEETGQEAGGRFLVGVRGALFLIDGDFHVGRTRLPYATIGSGSQVANGALFALSDDVPPKERAQRALEAAAEHTSVVRPPFSFIEL